MDGYVTIGTKLDTKDLEKGIRQAETELNKLDKEAKRLTEQKVTLEADNSELQQTIDKYDDLFNKAREYETQLKQMETSGQLWSSSYDITQKKLENITSQIASEEKGMLKAGEQIDKNNAKLEEINKKLKDNASSQDIVNAKVKEMNTELTQSQRIEGLKGAISGIQNKMSGIVKGAIKWGLAIFSVRSAYSFLTSSISTISQYDTQMATNIEYIRWALAMTLKPVVEYIVNLAVKLLGILRYIIKILFHYDIFANASAKAFAKAKQSTQGISGNLGKATKQAKELNKQLASFDEMNILGDNTKMAGDTGTSGAGGGTIQTPNIEIPEIKDVKIDWDKIWDTIENGIGMIKTNIAPMVQDIFTSIGQRFYDNASGWTTPLSNTFGDFFTTLGFTTKLEISGIGDTFKGLTQIVRGVFEGDIIGIVRGSFKTLQGVCETGVGSIGTLLNALATPFRSGFNKGLEIAEKVFNEIGKLVPSLKWDNLMVGLGNVIDKIKKKVKDLKTWISNTFKNIGTAIGNVFKSAFKKIFNGLVSLLEKRLNYPINAINSMIGVINKLLPKKKELTKLKTIKLPRLAKGGIVNMPSRGIPVGNAIAGERGAEGVIPLTDSQQMALLGEAIGKYITVNANITNNMNGRVISRELQKIQNDNNFAYNR